MPRILNDFRATCGSDERNELLLHVKATWKLEEFSVVWYSVVVEVNFIVPEGRFVSQPAASLRLKWKNVICSLLHTFLFHLNYIRACKVIAFLHIKCISFPFWKEAPVKAADSSCCISTYILYFILYYICPMVVIVHLLCVLYSFYLFDLFALWFVCFLPISYLTVSHWVSEGCI